MQNKEFMLYTNYSSTILCILKMLHILSDKKRRYFNDKFIDTTRLVLFENVRNGELYGHTDNYIQIQMEGGSDLINSIHSVKLVDNHGIVVDGKLS